ncbi:MAG: SAM-dependent methyltransferase, partial [Rubripirellula sp.]|nr:SAM-dependent methyltransferase [Rubripirellula sp.]
MNGRVFLIGAGPGDPNLLTIRGAQLLRNSDVVLYDGLCNPEILAHAPQALRVCVGKHGQTRIWRQEEITKEMIRYASEGKTVS